MEILKYGVTFQRLTADKIEVVRHWRNDPKISKYMEYREHITADMQKAWFTRINNEYNYYFIICYMGKEIGLTNVKNVDFSKKIGEGGIFIYEDEFLNSDVPFRVIFALNDFCFEELKLDSMIAHIMGDNKRAIDFNILLGYKKVDDSKSAENATTATKLTYILNKNDYFKQRNRFAKILTRG